MVAPTHGFRDDGFDVRVASLAAPGYLSEPRVRDDERRRSSGR